MSINPLSSQVVRFVHNRFIWPMLMEIKSCRQFQTVDACVLSYFIIQERSALIRKWYIVASMNTRRMRMAYLNLSGATLRLIAASAAWSTLQLRTKTPSVAMDCILEFLVEDPVTFDLHDYDDHLWIDTRVHSWIKRGGLRFNYGRNFDRRVAEVGQTYEDLDKVIVPTARLHVKQRELC